MNESYPNAKGEERYYLKTTLKRKGWTEAMIRDFLGEADIRFPVCGFLSRRYFYLASRVEGIEKTKAFKERRRSVKR